MGDETSSARQFLVKVEGVDGYFATKTGGRVAAETTKAYDGGNLKPDLISAPPGAENVTLTRPYKAARDADLIRRLKPLVGSYRTTVSVTPTDASMTAVAPPEVFPDALLVGLGSPEVDASSGDPATAELEFAISDYR